MLFATSAVAQFGMFEEMFGGHGHHQQHQPQNAGSDSAWYKQNYENSRLISEGINLRMY